MTEMPEEKMRHLEIIQNIVSRMNGNSFQIKACSVTILSILLAIYAVHGNVYLLLIGTLPTLIFWLLDAYYLQQERKFRGLYNTIIGSRNYITDTVKPFEMPIEKLTGRQFCYCNTFISRTIAGFHGIIFVIIILLFIIIKCY